MLQVLIVNHLPTVTYPPIGVDTGVTGPVTGVYTFFASIGAASRLSVVAQFNLHCCVVTYSALEPGACCSGLCTIQFVQAVWVRVHCCQRSSCGYSEPRLWSPPQLGRAAGNLSRPGKCPVPSCQRDGHSHRQNQIIQTEAFVVDVLKLLPSYASSWEFSVSLLQGSIHPHTVHTPMLQLISPLHTSPPSHLRPFNPSRTYVPSMVHLWELRVRAPTPPFTVHLPLDTVDSSS